MWIRQSGAFNHVPIGAGQEYEKQRVVVVKGVIVVTDCGDRMPEQGTNLCEIMKTAKRTDLVQDVLCGPEVGHQIEGASSFLRYDIRV